MNIRKIKPEAWGTICIIAGLITIFISWILHENHLVNVEASRHRQQFYYTWLMEAHNGQLTTLLMKELFDSTNTSVKQNSEENRTALHAFIDQGLKQIEYAAYMLKESHSLQDFDPNEDTTDVHRKPNFNSKYDVTKLIEYVRLLEDENNDTSMKQLNVLALKFHILDSFVHKDLNILSEKATYDNAQIGESVNKNYITAYYVGTTLLAVGFALKKLRKIVEILKDK
jgi:hypothetical protein